MFKSYNLFVAISVFFKYTRVPKHIMKNIRALGSESFIPLNISIICVALYLNFSS